MISEITTTNVIPESPERSRLFCHIEKVTIDTFFSLVDYRNNLFTSGDPNKITEFYNSFENRDHLIQWMKERPKGVANILEVNGNTDIIVVIPTTNFNGKYAIECRENIFKGLHIIFVESGGSGDFYFNFAHNVNVGIKKAIEYNPDWIVYSNDDIEKMSSPSILVSELKRYNDSNKNLILVKNRHVSPKCYVSVRSKRTSFFDIYMNWKWSNYFRGVKILNKFGVHYYFICGTPSLFYSHKSKFINTGSFCCYKGSFCKLRNGKIYDESIINSTEDLKLGMLLTAKTKEYSFLRKYNIKNLGGRALGSGQVRWIRGLSGQIYLDFQLRSNLLNS